MKHTCEETVMYGNLPIKCGETASTLVQHNGRDEGPYWMCTPHASHNIHNRDALDITPEAERVRTFTRVRDGNVNGVAYVIDDRYMPEVYALLSKLERQFR